VSNKKSLSQVWLSQADAAEFLGVTDRTIRNYIARGILPASRIKGSRSIRISQADLEELLRPIPSAKGA
jgi:excisionase family DNA binding protein